MSARPELLKVLLTQLGFQLRGIRAALELRKLQTLLLEKMQLKQSLEQLLLACMQATLNHT